MGLKSVVCYTILCLALVRVDTEAAASDAVSSASATSSPWAWACRPDRGCVKVGKPGKPQVPFANILEGDDVTNPSLAACKLTCHPDALLWPRPREIVHLARTLVAFSVDEIESEISAPSPAATALVSEAIDIFKETVSKDRLPEAVKQKAQSEPGDPAHVKLRIRVIVSEPGTQLTMATDESYTLRVVTDPAGDSDGDSTTTATLMASTFFGARHALETLSQLTAWDETLDRFVVLREAAVRDSPSYVHRGILLDTSRNFVTLPVLRKVIDAMSYNKLNVLHLHLTDTHSFPFASKREPRLSRYGAYSPTTKVYTEEDLKALVHYAKVRGVKLVPEVDAPAHVGAGWEWGEKDGLGRMVLCYNYEPWEKYCLEPPCGVLNPANENVYAVLGDVYRDAADAFESDVFHMGGDEVSFVCWNETQEVLDWLESRGRGDRSKDDFLHLWSHFQNRSLAELDRAYGREQPVILWTSGLTEEGHTDRFLDKDRYIIQIWTTGVDKSIAELYQQGFKLIFSNYDALYLDCGFTEWVGNASSNWCSPYIGWQKVYDNSPRNIINNFNLTFSNKQILGGEAALWTEQVDNTSVEARLWPRCAALGERLWSDPVTSWRAAESRLNHHKERIVRRGIQSEGLQPEWCVQHEGSCVQ